MDRPTGTNKETGIRRSQVFSCNGNAAATVTRSARSASTGLPINSMSRFSLGAGDNAGSAKKKYSVPSATTMTIPALVTTARQAN
jgi:hypothetical protein